MNTKCLSCLALVAAFLLFVPSSSNTDAQLLSVEVKTLSLGMVSETHRKEIEERFLDFVHYVARRLSSKGTEAEVVTAPTPFELAKLLEQRRVDFYMESAYPTYIINSVRGAGKLLLRRWKGGLADYHSVIFARTNGGVKRLEDLKQKTIALEDAGRHLATCCRNCF